MINLGNMCPNLELKTTTPNMPSISATMKLRKYLGVRDTAKR